MPPLFFFRDYIEGAPVTVEQCTLPRVLLKAAHYTVGVFWINLHQSRGASAALAGYERRARTSEKISDDVPCLAAIEQYTLKATESKRNRSWKMLMDGMAIAPKSVQISSDVRARGRARSLSTWYFVDAATMQETPGFKVTFPMSGYPRDRRRTWRSGNHGR